MSATPIIGVRYVYNGTQFTAPGRPPLDGPVVIPPTGNPRDSLVYGTYIPGMTANTVGLINPTAAFTDVFPASTADGYIYIDSTATVGGTVDNPISNIRYWGKVKPRVTGNVYFSNCQFLNRKPEDMYANNVGANGGCVENFGANPPHLFFVDCLFDPKAWFNAGQSTYWGHPVQVGVHGGNFTAERTEWRNCQDGINYVGPNTAAAASSAFCKMYACWIHANFYLKPWSGPGAPASADTHSDAFQWNTGSNFDLRYNLWGGMNDLTGYNASLAYNSGDDCHNSACIIQQEQDTSAIAHVGNVNVSDNWMAGGAATINANLKNGNAGADWTFARNKLARRGVGAWAGSGYYIYRNGGLSTVFDSNVIWDYNGAIAGTGVPVPIVNYPGT